MQILGRGLQECQILLCSKNKKKKKHFKIVHAAFKVSRYKVTILYSQVFKHLDFTPSVAIFVGRLLTLTILWANSADNKLIIFFLFFLENRI